MDQKWDVYMCVWAGIRSTTAPAISREYQYVIYVYILSIFAPKIKKNKYA